MAKVYSVTQITSYLKGLITRDPLLSFVSVSGELSNVKYHVSGHIYFTLKDEGAQLAGVMFSSDTGGLDFRLAEGMKVNVTGSIGIYDKAGTYQIYARKITKEGRGELYERYLKLKDELEDMGMFADEYKQAIPEYIKRLGVVTASTGAAVRDIINITRRRNPYVEIILYPAKVQGEGAAESVARGIEVLNRTGVDVIIAGRGGGSIEDLWAFNEVIVAEAIFHSRTPVISAVGHETDTTIADFVADLRAPTPSAAAELAVYDYGQYLERLDSYRAELRGAIGNHIVRDRLKLKEAESELKKKRPDAVIAAKKLRLADIENGLRRLMSDKLSENKDHMAESGRRMRDAMHKKQSDRRHSIVIYAEKLKGVSPLEKLTQGYSYVADENGKNIRDASLLSVGDRINIYMLNGRVKSAVTEVDGSYGLNKK
ncbi:MAG: exodeoxyribonuclease VII large subunit [Lachnospiraceae bacterium]|nr:exodeoxyribonuclease VII large subunit [Lachnospiraceae bacterium]